MKLYKHEYFASKNQIVTTEFDAEKRPGGYRVPEHPGMGMIADSMMGRFFNLFDYSMYTLSPDTTCFIEALIENNRKESEKCEKKIEKLKRQQAWFLEELEVNKNKKRIEK